MDTGSIDPEIFNDDWNEDCSDDDQPKRIHYDTLSKYFGHKVFRPMQWDIIRTAICDKRDQCIVLATGYGKSLCFQFPSVFTNSTTIVISPLISLMEDQVRSLDVLGIPACFLGTAQKKTSRVLEEIMQNKYRLIYITPEWCIGEFGMSLIEEMHKHITLSLVAFDEAHCVSKWGHDFRTAYRQLGRLRDILPDVPVLAVTATATKKVQADICTVLKMKNPVLRCSGFDRPNLFFEVHPKLEKGSEIKSLMPFIEAARDGSVIIYTLTKKDADDLTTTLKSRINCETYHAGLSLGQRNEVHEKFTRDEINVIVATIAFGMGIDKPDVRLVIHYGASKDLESYYQEVGRAGRDGLPSKCVTFFNNADFAVHEALRRMSKSSQANLGQHMKDYLYSNSCRRRLILSYFSGKQPDELKLEPNKQCCDNCQKTTNSKPVQYTECDENGLYDFTSDSLALLSVSEHLNGRYGLTVYVKFLRGLKVDKVRESLKRHQLYGSGKRKTDEWWKIIGRLLEGKGYLVRKEQQMYYTLEISKSGAAYLENIRKNKDLDIMKLAPPQDVIPFLRKKVVLDSDEDDDVLILKPFQTRKQFTLTTEKTATDLEENKNLNSKPLPLKVLPNTSNIPGVLRLYDNSDKESVKQFNQKLFTELKALRNNIAHDMDCMPFNVASDIAVMQMVKILPMSLATFHNAGFDNFNEIKINKFGPQFTAFIKDYLQQNGDGGRERLTLEALLNKHPLEKSVPLSPTILKTYTMFAQGMSPMQIAKSRSIVIGTVYTHINNLLAAGYPLKLTGLQLTKEAIVSILRVAARQSVKKITNIKLTTLKDYLPDIDWNELRMVHTYIKIREHAESVTSSYTDDDCEWYKMYMEFKNTVYDEDEEILKFKNTQATDTQATKTTSSEISTATAFETEEEEDKEILAALEYLGDHCNQTQMTQINDMTSQQKIEATNRQKSSELIIDFSDDDKDLFDFPHQSTQSRKRKSNEDEASLTSSKNLKY